jgi:two-component system phosphate regulon response regulator PhoB
MMEVVMSKKKILVIEDEADILELVAYNLEKSGYTVFRAKTGENGITIARTQLPDLIILDLMLPGIDGIEVCHKLKNEPITSSIPIIMLTAKIEDNDIVTGLEAGADDYIPKPFSPKILLARIKTMLRRIKNSGKENVPEIISVHGITIDTVRHIVKINDHEINLSATEYAILKHLAQNPGWVFNRNQIIDAVRGGNYPVTDRSVDVQILGLRKKLGPKGEVIETVRGFGYRMRGKEKKD